MKTMKLSFYLFLFLGLSICYSQQAPTWLTNRPDDKVNYIGIGRADKSIGDYQNLAKKLALEEIASQIEIQISSETFLSRYEEGGKLSETFRTEIRAKTSESVTNMSIIDTWQTEREYWVYLSLNKEKFKLDQEKRKQLAISVAKDYLMKSMAEAENGNVANATSLATRGLASINEFYNKPIITDLDGKEIILQNHLHYVLTKYLSGIKVLSAEEKVILVSGLNFQNHSTQIRVSPSMVVPIKLTAYKLVTYRGGSFKRDLEKKNQVINLSSDMNGNLQVTPFEYYFNRYGVSVDATLDLNRLATVNLSPTILSTLPIPRCEINFIVKRKIVSVEFDDDLLPEGEDSIEILSATDFQSWSENALDFVYKENVVNESVLGDKVDLFLVGAIGVKDWGRDGVTYTLYYKLYDSDKKLIDKGREVLFVDTSKNKRDTLRWYQIKEEKRPFKDYIKKLVELAYR